MIRDIGLLNWFLTEGVTDYERSAFGAALEAAKMNQVVKPSRVPARRRKLPNECAACGAPAEHETCDECHFSAALKRVRYSAEITSEYRTKHVPTPEDESMVKLARASQRKRAMQSVSPVHWEALAAYYGDIGSQYQAAAYRPYCRLLAVMPLTEEGQWLNQRALEDDNNPSMGDVERIRFLISKSANTNKYASRITQAGIAAGMLFAEAEKLWNEATEAQTAHRKKWGKPW